MNESPISYLNSNDGNSILAFGDGPKIKIHKENSIENIQKFIDKQKNKYIFFCLSYDLKNDIEPSLKSQNCNSIIFPRAILWVPETVVKINSNNINFIQGIKTKESNSFVEKFLKKETNKNYSNFKFKFHHRTSKESYIENVIQLQEHIQQGDIFEVNYCQEFFLENIEIEDPLNTYFKLNDKTEAPYSSYTNIDDFILFCGSPECFLRKKKNHIISSPIKGTRKRGKSKQEDDALKTELLNDPKEQSENIMIVDLVRNDLSRIAIPGSVKVDELFGIYSFKTVHQMISTISCQVPESIKFKDILRATFPMGSMTGAPKHSAMNLIEHYEEFQRGIYSGSIGYINPNGDFDMNVVIRTLIFNKKEKYLSCPVGSAITINSDPISEYEECLIKIKSISDY